MLIIRDIEGYFFCGTILLENNSRHKDDNVRVRLVHRSASTHMVTAVSIVEVYDIRRGKEPIPP
jgi:hypothetical protein